MCHRRRREGRGRSQAPASAAARWRDGWWLADAAELDAAVVRVVG